MGTGKRRISTAVRGLAARVVGSRVLAPVVRVVPAVRVALAVPEDQVVPAVRAALVELVLAIVPAEVRALAIVLAEALVPVIALAEVRAAVIALGEVREPETVQAAAVPVRSHLRAQLAVPLKT